MANIREETAFVMQPMMGVPYVEVLNPQTLEPEHWQHRLLSMAREWLAEADAIKARGTKSRNARQKASLADMASLLASASENVAERMQTTASGALHISLQRGAKEMTVQKVSASIQEQYEHAWRAKEGS